MTDNIVMLNKRFEYEGYMIGICGDNVSDMAISVAMVLGAAHAVAVLDLTGAIFNQFGWDGDVVAAKSIYFYQNERSIRGSYDILVVCGDFAMHDIYSRCDKLFVVYDFIYTKKHIFSRFSDSQRGKYSLIIRHGNSQDGVKFENTIGGMLYPGIDISYFRENARDNSCVFDFNTCGKISIHLFSPRYIGGIVSICTKIFPENTPGDFTVSIADEILGRL